MARPAQGSLFDETSTVRLMTGLVATLLAVAAFMVTQEGGAASDPPPPPD